MVVIGDSIVDQATATFHQRLDPTFTVTVSAVGGSRADQRARDPDLAALATGRVDRVVIDLGTNDVLQGTPPTQTIEALDHIAALFGAASVFVVTVTEGIFGEGEPTLRDRSVALNRLLRATAAARGWTVIPWDRIVRRYVDAGEPLGPITTDTIHPTFTGRWLLADACARALRSPIAVPVNV